MSDCIRNVAVVGYFASTRSLEGDRKDFGGQTAKCRMLRDWLLSFDLIRYSEIDTYQWKKKPIRLLLQTINEVKSANAVIMALSENGLRMFMPLLLVLKRLYGFRLGYVVIGGWIAKRCNQDLRLLKMLQHLDAVFAETITMADELRALGLENVRYVPNAKRLDALSEPLNVDIKGRPLPICTFSRVCREKGVTTAMDAVVRINSEYKNRQYALDIYGPIAEDYRAEFERLLSLNPDCLSYKGSVPAGESVGVLSSYLLLLFPTRCYGEGFPGTVVDAYSAGLPVICSDWQNARSIVADGKTGILYEFDDPDGAYRTLKMCLNNLEMIVNMRRDCLEESIKYTPGRANAPIWDFINY